MRRRRPRATQILAGITPLNRSAPGIHIRRCLANDPPPSRRGLADVEGWGNLLLTFPGIAAHVIEAPPGRVPEAYPHLKASSCEAAGTSTKMTEASDCEAESTASACRLRDSSVGRVWCSGTVSSKRTAERTAGGWINGLGARALQMANSRSRSELRLPSLPWLYRAVS